MPVASALFGHVGQPISPDTFTAFGMSHTEHRNDVLFHNKDDSVGKTLGKHPADGMTTVSKRIKKRIGLEGIDGLADLVNESFTEACFAFFVPERRLFNVGLNLRTEPKLVCHWLKRWRNRASTSSQGTAASGFASCSARRCSMRTRSASVSSPLSNQSPPSSSQILSRISRRSSGLSLGSSVRMSVLPMQTTLSDPGGSVQGLFGSSRNLASVVE